MEKEQILQALKGVLPDRGADISDIRINGDQVYVIIDVLPALGNQIEDIRQAVETTVSALDGVTRAHVILTAEKKPPPQIPVKNAPSKTVTHKISNKPVAPNVKYIVAVASGKGGVGKSTVAANLALAFAAMGKKAGLLDADIYGSSQPMMMGDRSKPETNDDDMIVPLQLHGIPVMSMGFFVEADKPVIWRGPMVHSAIQQLLRDVEWGDLDVLVVDLPPGTGDAHLSMAQYVPMAGAVIISTPQEVALNEARKGLKMFEKTNVPILGMIENMSSYECSNCGHTEHIFGHGTVKKSAEKLGVNFLGDIPLQPIVRQHADAGMPIVAKDPHHAISESFKNIASRLWMDLSAKEPYRKMA